MENILWIETVMGLLHDAEEILANDVEDGFHDNRVAWLEQYRDIKRTLLADKPDPQRAMTLKVLGT